MILHTHRDGDQDALGWTRRFKAQRDFGLSVGGLLLLVGAWWLARGKFNAAAPYVTAAGMLLLMLALVIPKALTLPNRGWMALAAALSYVSTRIILGLVFYLIVTPLGFIKRRQGWDPLMRRRPSAPSYWEDYAARDAGHYEELF